MTFRVSLPYPPRLIRLLVAVGLVVGPVVAGCVGALAAPAGGRQGSLQAAYARAERELPKEYFPVYAIVDRIARANGLDGKPWRIVVTSNYSINAYATEANLLVFEAGLLDQLEGNSSALACAIGHEIGHHVRQHQGYGPAKQQQAMVATKNEAEREKQRTKTNRAVIDFISQVLTGRSAQQPNSAAAAENEIDLKAQETIKQRLVQISQAQELEADESGYRYSVTAGFDADGCIGVMEILGRMPGAQMAGGSHPPPALRTEAIKELVTRYPPATLKAQGRTALNARPMPLSYEMYRMGTQNGGVITGLKVFPVTGSTLDDLKRKLLGN
jgi:beta-barrel assembly-enhancing protease